MKKEIAALIREAYPSGVYDEDERSPKQTRRYLTSETVEHITGELNRLPRIGALANRDRNYDVSYHITVSSPSTEVFLRRQTLGDTNYLRFLDRIGGNPSIMALRLSLLGPYWMSTWSVHSISRGRLKSARLSHDPPDDFWRATMPAVQLIFSKHRLRFLTEEEVDEIVPWMRPAPDSVVPGRIRVYHCLFSAI